MAFQMPPKEPPQPSAVQSRTVQPSAEQPRAVQSSSASAGGAEQVQQHGGWGYQPLSACPASGTVTDLLDWAVPTRVEPVEVPQSQVQQPAAVTGGSVSDPQATPQPRRSTRAGRGQTRKFDDYVQSMSYRNKYEQVWPALGGGKA